MRTGIFTSRSLYEKIGNLEILRLDLGGELGIPACVKVQKEEIGIFPSSREYTKACKILPT